MSDLVVVTGTSSGVGVAIASGLVSCGYRVVGVSRRPADERLDVSGYTHVRQDLARTDEIPALVRVLVGDHGVPYGLVNNAAVGADGLLATMHNSEIERTLALDLLSPLLLTKYISRHMASAGRGRVVSISSIVATTGFRGLSVYAAAKSGLEGMTRSLARDLGRRGVTVNCVAPGFLDTEMTQGLGGGNLESIRRRSPLGRFATPDEVAAAVEYLMSARAAAVTGTVLTVDAGSTA